MRVFVSKMKGIVKFFNKSKGFGFITEEEEQKDYFVHMSGLAEGEEISDGDAVTFEVEDGERGPKAVNVTKSDGSSDSAEEVTDSEDFGNSEDEEDN